MTHVTRYTYGATVELTNGVLRLIPITGAGQTLLRTVLVSDPPCLAPTERVDAFGNRVASLRIEKPHRELTITAASRVRVERAELPEHSPAWEDVAEEALTVDSLAPDCPAIALFPSRRISFFDEATSYARESFSDRRQVLEGAIELSRRIRADFVYDPEATEVTTRPQEVFKDKRGVCQDFAHFMIAALRGLALPALYVSGYIRTAPPPGKERLAGADASHAWVSIWCGSAIGWRDFDPTNAMLVANDHIAVARGRDYSDASPIESMVLSSGSHRLEVHVDVIPV